MMLASASCAFADSMAILLVASPTMSRIRNRCIRMAQPRVPCFHSSKPPMAADDEERMRKILGHKLLSQHEQVMKRPGMYIGSVDSETAMRWVFDPANASLMRKEVVFTPGLLKLFDEVITNSLDASVKDETVKLISVFLSAENVRVKNNGIGIPVEMHPEHGMYVPEMVFGHLNSSSNYDDEAGRVVAGVHGLGVKLVSIFSSEFHVSVRDARTGSTFEQTWRDQMRKRTDPKIRLHDKQIAGYVDVRFSPVAALGALTEDVRGLMAKRALDVALAARSGVRVEVNGVRLPEMTLKRYAQMLVGEQAFVAIDEPGGPWKVALAATDDPFIAGMVNGVTSSGSHVQHVEQRVYAALGAALKAKRDFKGFELKPAMMRARFAIFVVATVDKPAWDSQTKDRCGSFNTRATPDYVPSESFIKKLAGCDAVAQMADAERAKADKKAAAKTDGKMSSTVRVPKLVDAVFAGTAKSKECTLILTEGDSAKAFAVAGLSVLGHDRWGVFPLRGKLLNCREASTKQISENAEIKNIKTILGLKAGDAHTGATGLRYGSVLALTDADVDGKHIAGLLLSFLHHGWPLLAKSGFLRTLPTPLIRATKGNEARDFFTTTAFDAWNSGSPSGYRVRYYKGLGSWGSSDAKDIFRKVSPVRFVDSPETEDRIRLGFEKKRTDDRKLWIQACTASPPLPLDYTHDVTISDFIDRDLVHFAAYSVHRAIPSICDSLKPSQRKILFTTFERGYTSLTKLIKCAQLAGAVAERTLYTHGESSVNEAIICMAQSFAGSNNLPLLYGDGQFGTRLENGKDAASPRYIFCCASPLARKIFCPADDPVLTYATEEGQQIEPTVYWPIVPMILVNAATGIATGYSTDIPPHSLADVKANVLRFLSGEPFLEMVPHFVGFKGTVTPISMGNYRIEGVYERRGDTFVVTELPPNGKSYSAYAEWAADSETSKVRLLKNKCTDTDCYFEIQFVGEVPENPAVALKLVTTLSTGNMHAFDTAGAIRKYSTTEDILAEWCAWRLGKYAVRLGHLARKLAADADELASRARFVKAVATKKLMLGDFEEGALLKTLADKGFVDPEKLVNMPAKSFTLDRAAAIERAAEAARTAAVRAAAMTPEEAWKDDLSHV